MKGQCDNQPWGATEEYLKLFPVHKFVYVREAGHFINVEQHDTYIREIRNFLLEKQVLQSFNYIFASEYFEANKSEAELPVFFSGLI